MCIDASTEGVLLSLLWLCVEMVTSQVCRCDHPAVQLQFFETVVRYEKFFGTEPQFLPDVLVCDSCVNHNAVGLWVPRK